MEDLPLLQNGRFLARATLFSLLYRLVGFSSIQMDGAKLEVGRYNKVHDKERQRLEGERDG